MDLERPLEIEAEDGLGKAGHHGTGIPSGIQLQEEVASGLQSEGAMCESSHMTSQESFEPTSRLSPGSREPRLFGEKPWHPLGSSHPIGQEFTHSEEGFFRVGTP